MLTRSKWILTVAEETTLPRAYRLELIKLLHQRMNLPFEGEIPNLSYSGITGRYSNKQDFLTFYPGEPYQISMCGLQEQASKSIANLDLGDRLEFLGATFEVGEREDETTSYETLYQTLVANEPEPIQQFQLKFVTPTAFSQGKIYLPLPLPSLMFRSWLERWNHFAPVYLGSTELVGYLEQAIAFSRHRLQTAPFRVHTGQVTGFKGDITLRVLHSTDPLLVNVANLLIHYSEFAGTGIKTRLGMGQTLLIKPSLEPP
jgi:CRISPR-associated endoribonuclease Cas6